MISIKSVMTTDVCTIKPDAAIFHYRYCLACDSAGYELVQHTSNDKIQLRINI